MHNSFSCFYSDDIDDLISVTSVDSRRRAPVTDFTENPEDDRESVQSGLATLPDSSYAGFERVQPPSSTPNRAAVRDYINVHLCMSLCEKISSGKKQYSLEGMHISWNVE